MIQPRLTIKEYLGAFVAKHVDLSTGRVSLQVSSREMEMLAEALVRDLIAWSMEFKRPPYTVCGNLDAEFQADIGVRGPGVNGDQEELLVDISVGEIFALGQFYVLGVLKWAESIQLARHGGVQLRNAILAKQAQMAAGKEPGQRGG